MRRESCRAASTYGGGQVYCVRPSRPLTTVRITSSYEWITCTRSRSTRERGGWSRRNGATNGAAGIVRAVCVTTVTSSNSL